MTILINSANNHVTKNSQKSTKKTLQNPKTKKIHKKQSNQNNKKIEKSLDSEESREKLKTKVKKSPQKKIKTKKSKISEKKSKQKSKAKKKSKSKPKKKLKKKSKSKQKKKTKSLKKKQHKKKSKASSSSSTSKSTEIETEKISTTSKKCEITGYTPPPYLKSDSPLKNFSFLETHEYFENINITDLELCYLRCSPEQEASKILCDLTFLQSMKTTCNRLPKPEIQKCLETAKKNTKCLETLKTSKTCKSKPAACRVLRTKYLQTQRPQKSQNCQNAIFLDRYKCLYSDGTFGICENNLDSENDPKIQCLEVSENCDEETGVFGVCFRNSEWCYENLQSDGFFKKSFNLKTFRPKWDPIDVGYFGALEGLGEDPDSLYSFDNRLCDFEAFEIVDLEYDVQIPLSCSCR